MLKAVTNQGSFIDPDLRTAWFAGLENYTEEMFCFFHF